MGKVKAFGCRAAMAALRCVGCGWTGKRAGYGSTCPRCKRQVRA